MRHVDIKAPLAGRNTLRRAVTLLKKADGLPILIDVFDVEGGSIHDYNMHAHVPHEIPALLGGRQEEQTFFTAVGSQDFYTPPDKVIRPASFSVEPTLLPRRNKIYQQHSYYPLKNFMTAGRTEGGWQANWKRQERQVTAHVLSDCDELITYQSPAWRSQSAIAAEPNDYANSVLLRNKGTKSRFVVVYEVAGKKPEIRWVTMDKKPRSDAIQLKIHLRAGRNIVAHIPNKPTREEATSNFSVQWNRK